MFGALLGACSSSSILQPPTPSKEARSVIAALEEASGRPRWIRAFELDEGWAISEVLEDGDRVVVASYDRPLAALGLGPGDVPTGAGGEGACARLHPIEVQLTVAGAPFVESALDRGLREALVPDGDRRCGWCRELRESRVTVAGEDERPGAGGPLSDGRVVASFADGFQMFSRTEQRRVQGCEGLYGRAMLPIGSDRFEVASHGGRIERVAFELASERCTVLLTRTASPAGTLSWITGAPDGSEVYALDERGNVHRAIGDGPFEHIATLPIHPKEGVLTSEGALAWLGPGEIVGTASAMEVRWLKDGRLTRRELMPSTRESVVLVELATKDGIVYASDSEGWINVIPPGNAVPRRLDDSPVRWSVGSILPDRDGFIAVIGSGDVVEYYPPIGFCASPHQIRGVAANGRESFIDASGAVVVVDMVGASNGTLPQIVWLDGASSR